MASLPGCLAVLSICSGIGGIDLGLRLALGDATRTVGYIERDAYAAAVLVARMADKALDPAPIWDDLQTFDGFPWRRKVGLITAGFPCQPASLAGSRAGTKDQRWLWADIARITDEVQPAFVFLENVPGLLTVNGGAAFGQILSTLARLGFDAEWDCFSAKEVGAPHLRKRVFILGYAKGLGDRKQRNQGLRTEGRQEPGRTSVSVGNSVGSNVEVRKPQPISRAFPATFPPSPSDDWSLVEERFWPTTERAVFGSSDGAADRMDRLRVIGNGVVPLVVATAFLALARRVGLIDDD